MTPTSHTDSNTTHKAVVPFYIYAALSLLAATLLLSFSTEAFTEHYFHPRTLAITHLMALGWGTMVILGASHQLVPVLIESGLYSTALAYAAFVLAGIGIPIIAWSFFQFSFGTLALTGGVLVNLAIVCYLANLFVSITKSKTENVHAVFIFSAATWLLITCFIGLLLMANFSMAIFSADSVQYLSLHAHLGIVGWFLMMVLGVGSRLIPMFLISKYENSKLLWSVFYLVNLGLAAFIIIFFTASAKWLYLLPAASIFVAIVLFARYCNEAYKVRIRKTLDEPMQVSMASVALMALPLLLVLVIAGSLLAGPADQSQVLAYGFTIFFGWITAIIFGMTFKTLPFILWTRIYHERAGLGKTPQPKELYSSTLFNLMALLYGCGFLLFFLAVLTEVGWALQAGSYLLLGAAILYNGNIFKMIFHKAK